MRYRVTEGGLEPSAIVLGELGEFSRRAHRVTSHLIYRQGQLGTRLLAVLILREQNRTNEQWIHFNSSFKVIYAKRIRIKTHKCTHLFEQGTYFRHLFRMCVLRETGTARRLRESWDARSHPISCFALLQRSTRQYSVSSRGSSFTGLSQKVDDHYAEQPPENLSKCRTRAEQL